MIFDAPNSNRFWADLLVEELIRCGVDFFSLAPGSRSTPLTTAVAAHPQARHHIHFDERGSAFLALGHARATRRPAAWITTSGTALANGFPAVIEAAIEGVPLLLLTADRPPELRDTGANQTIDQVKLFGAYVRWFVDLPAPDPQMDPAMVLTTVDQAVYRALRSPAGPVHLNCMFREPLAPDADGFDPERYRERLGGWWARRRPYTDYRPARSVVEAAPVAALLEDAGRGLVVAGKLDDPAEGQAAARVARHLGWPLVADIGSGVRLGPDPTGGLRIDYADQVLACAGFVERHRPDAVVHLGRRATSKRLLQALERTAPPLYLTVAPTPERLDPTHQVTHRLEAPVAALAAALAAGTPRQPDAAWLRAWQHASAQAEAAIEAVLEEDGTLSEPLVARLVTRHLPPEHGLFLASSMPVRDADMYAVGGAAAVPVAANRGASGIDGTVASAAGFAAGLARPVTLLIGDLALLHDLNSLALLRRLPVPVVVVAINNDGGGIFHFLPIAKHAGVFEPYFGTPHGLTFEAAAALFGLAYARPETPAAFEAAYREAVHRPAATLIEVRTDRTANAALHRRLLAAVQTRLDDGDA
ncbi:2-succinyl-5-enolpyruvyl-6-hydroxy-3-cyclohexene-1-carboxylate synthase [Rhodothermaceae bacterium RA]|nr:2-succinyl-5-enolpyruvyl-6-hydroxy-3-cyclohexene-1-carboxylate synthase [Rhodothermaceae bacterium RA]